MQMQKEYESKSKENNDERQRRRETREKRSKVGQDLFKDLATEYKSTYTAKDENKQKSGHHRPKPINRDLRF